MGRNTSILLGDHFDNFISEKIASGKFNSASEVIRTSLRLLEEEEKQIELLREALKIGEKSGFVKNFDPVEHLEKLHRKHL
ncbi:antitoxin [Pedobacter ginsenosidimutans]|uniref:Antitoxin n=1 Tax=Pedobacter ginsenosidimutans TaxID=687842 RepID=A0A0T5VII2_9SPHI|nr:type II toxin-antitoxin system ParD family antitoxin [Pedobacter ginsenosidimutans]KRT13045.1 antitoxin [Pedobacter ginsenosidimutans]